MDDELLEVLRADYCREYDIPFTPINISDVDCRAKRITAYLDVVGEIVAKQLTVLRSEPFEPGNEISLYFELLPDCEIKQKYLAMLALPECPEKIEQQEQLRTLIVTGSVDVNIMSKIDKTNFATDGSALPAEYSDAMASLRGYANSSLKSSLVLSAGYNPKLYNYLESFVDFYPDEQGVSYKKIILKVSDFRSAAVQGRLLAKRGIWVSEFRIESGLNCGGHAFATEGHLLGPILEEFKLKKDELATELYALCNQVNEAKGRCVYKEQPVQKVTVQGGIGTHNEHDFLLQYYKMDSTGWGSPFLLVPEVTNVDKQTLQQLATAVPSDYYLSNASPLGVPFNNFRKSSSEKQRMDRIEKGRPGSPCYKKYLVSDSEFTDEPVCTASRVYQHHKLKQLADSGATAEKYKAEYDSIVEKDCLCEGLGAPVRINKDLPLSHNLKAVTICPGPNLAYFSGIFSLSEMVGHIYGRVNLLNNIRRPNFFINELVLYKDYYKKEIAKSVLCLSDKKAKYFKAFKENLLEGISYYKKIIPELIAETEKYCTEMRLYLENIEQELKGISHPAFAN